MDFGKFAQLRPQNYCRIIGAGSSKPPEIAFSARVDSLVYFIFVRLRLSAEVEADEVAHDLMKLQGFDGFLSGEHSKMFKPPESCEYVCAIFFTTKKSLILKTL